MTDAAPKVRDTARPTIDPDLEKAMQVARGLLVANDMADLAQRAWSQLTAPGRAPTVVVVGEAKRGKSSLVNALLARPGSSPVDDDIATTTFVQFVPPRDSTPERQTTLLYAGGRRQTVDFAELADWVTTSGRHVTDSTIDELPIGAEVVLGSPLLPGVTLVDTPGVGGLNPNHLPLTRTATATASIVLMTCEAKAPIGKPELDFLKTVSAEVDSVLIAVTKTDQNLRHWRSILEENRRLLGEHAPRFADIPMLGVSSVFAASALQMEPGDRRVAAVRASGLFDIIRHLKAMCISRDTLAASNALRAARTGLERIAEQLNLQRSAMIGGQTAAAELSEEQQRLQALRQQWDGGWRDFLQSDFSMAQRRTVGVLEQKVDELRASWKARLDKTQLDVLRRSPQLYVTDMTADLEALIAEISDHYTTEINTLISELEIDVDISVEALSVGVREVEKPRKRGEGVLDPQMMSVASSGIGSIGIGIASALSLGALAIPVGIAIGGAYVAVNFGFRAIKAGKQGLQQWLNMTATAVVKDVSREIQDRGDMIRPVIINQVKQHLTESMSQLKTLIAAAETAAKASRTERADALAELDTKHETIQRAIAGLDTQLAILTTAKSSHP
jgi:hypothetical protein